MDWDYREVTNTAMWAEQHFVSAECYWGPATPTICIYLHAVHGPLHFHGPFRMAEADLSSYNRNQVAKKPKILHL